MNKHFFKEMQKEAFIGPIVNAAMTTSYAMGELKANKAKARLVAPGEPEGAAGANQSQFLGGKNINQQPPQLPNYSLYD